MKTLFIALLFLASCSTTTTESKKSVQAHRIYRDRN